MLLSDTAPRQPIRRRWLWLSAFLGLLLVQGALALRLFGPERSWEHLLDDELVTDGQHPLHQYHGALGAETWRASGSGCCYDPAFYAGYPKTPVFDSGCRAAEWYQLVAGVSFRPAAYKIGLAMCCWLAPFGLWAAARVLGLRYGPGYLAAVLGMVVMWSAPGVAVLEQGDYSVTLLGVTAALNLAVFARLHEQPSVAGWCSLLGTAAVGWSLHPFLWAGLSLLIVGIWLGVSRRHGPGWHGGLFLAQAGALALNLPAWHDWLRYWWIRVPSAGLSAVRSAEGASALARPLSFGEGIVEWLVFAFLFMNGIGSGLRRWGTGRWCPTTWLAVAAGLVLLTAVASYLRPILVPFTPVTLLVLGLWLAAVPVAHSLARAATWLRSGAGRPHIGVIVGGSLFLLVAGLVAHRPTTWDFPDWGPRPLTLGLPPAARALATVLGRVAVADARVLWEDRPGRIDLGWTVLLPSRIGRPFIGGLDADGTLEHAAAALRNGHLAGRPLPLWTDTELDGYCRRYNVGWVVCATAAARDRFGRWPVAAALPTPAAADGWTVFVVQRPHSFVLKGQAGGFEADHRRITLTDLVPEGDEVVLSLHYQEGWSVRPAWVRVERELDPYDPIPFVRIRAPGPVGRVTLTWGRP
jgi:hypothetical protein